MVHLDTSFLIRALVRGSREDALLREWLDDGEDLRMSAIAWTEFLCGPIAIIDHELASRVVSARVVFTEDQATVAARLFNESGRRRGSMVDCMIAAAALAERAPIVTANPDDFGRFTAAGLGVIDAASRHSAR
jgi:predicted nucleic acid-binding protein